MSVFISNMVWPSYLWDGVWQQCVEFLVGAVPDAAPARRVKVLPDRSDYLFLIKVVWLGPIDKIWYMPLFKSVNLLKKMRVS